jgi:hypothetical protein
MFVLFFYRLRRAGFGRRKCAGPNHVNCVNYVKCVNYVRGDVLMSVLCQLCACACVCMCRCERYGLVHFNLIARQNIHQTHTHAHTHTKQTSNTPEHCVGCTLRSVTHSDSVTTV